MQLLIHDYAGHPFQVQLSRELARRGHSVLHAFAGGLLTPRGNLQKKADDLETFELTEVPMHANYRRHKYRFVRRWRMEVEYGWKIAALIQKQQPDVVISANTPSEPQLRIANTCSRLGIRFVPWIQDFYSIAVAKLAKKKLPVIGSLIGWWYRQLERRTLRQASAVVAITSDFLPMLRQLGVPEEKNAVIPNWAPLEELPRQPRRNAWSATYGLDDKFVFLYSGTLAMKHNPELLWQLAVRFEDGSGVRVVVVSEGPGADWLAKEKEKEPLPNLILLPFQPFQRMSEVMASGDVLIAVLESDAGVFSVPSKVLSYHCAGRTLLGAMPLQNLAAKIILDNRTGLCTAPDDFEGFLKAAERLYADGELRSQCGERARIYAENNFDIKKIACRFEECILP
jgi:glycosyltransferase involved in cell wall biosynthesis